MEATSVGTEVYYWNFKDQSGQRTDGSRVVTTSAPITVDSQLDNPEQDRHQDLVDTGGR